MSRHWIALLLAATAPAGITAQATNDEARLVVGIIGGWIGGGHLWDVTQPAYASLGQIDEFDLSRSLRSNITMSGQVTYFPTPGFGWTGELSYLGLGAKDKCFLSVNHSDNINNLACATINGANRSASAVSGAVGVVLRPASRSTVQPYLRANVGLALVPRSHTTMAAFFGDDDDYAVIIYDENGSKAVKPIGALSLGISTAPRSGYQLRLEARASAVQLQVVDGPTPLGVSEPNIRSQWKVLPSISAGLDIVLEKRRGRRS
ncbi:MAG TPA: hypothetical protein PLL69_05600 [Gemmatimonadales bacterium]|nr:hypothetical protein [Gemmatimonadales bacterium]